MAGAWAVMNEFGASALTATSDLEAAFEALENGEVDYVAADAVSGMYLVNVEGYEASIVAALEQPSGYVIGVLGTNAALQQVIVQALEDLQDGGIVSVIESKWLGTVLDLSDVPMTAGVSASATTSEEDAEAEETTGDA